MQTHLRKIKAYSIVEMLVTMAIFGIIMVMLLQSLFLNIKLTTQINLRSRFNTDIDQLVSLITRDIRNSDFYYTADSGFIEACAGQFCTLSLNSIPVKWSLNSNKVTRQVYIDPTISTNYTSTSIMQVNSLEFYINSTETSNGEARLANILVTIKVEPANSGWKTDYGIGEQVRQISVSTRNYDVKF